MDKPIHIATDYGEYEISDVLYDWRRARVLYSSGKVAAQSGIPLDDKDEMLFDYNERFMELFRGLEPRSVLLIGGGSFTLPAAMLRYDPLLHLDIVEPDGQLEDVGKQYFDYIPGEHTRSFAMGGAAYLQACTDTYDMILIDAFVKDVVPAELQTEETIRQLRQALKPKGLLAMNLISSYRGRRSALLQRLYEQYTAVFGAVEIFPAGHGVSEWLPQNYVLCAGIGKPEEYLRYPAMPTDELLQQDII